MPEPSLAQLVAAGLLQTKPPDPRRVRAWAERSRRYLELAQSVLAAIDADRAMAVAYEAGYRACAGLIDLAGYRVTSQPGHQRAALDATLARLGEERRSLLRRMDRARRFRNESLYGDVPRASAGELEQLMKDAAALLERVELALG